MQTRCSPWEPVFCSGGETPLLLPSPRLPPSPWATQSKPHTEELFQPGRVLPSAAGKRTSGCCSLGAPAHPRPGDAAALPGGCRGEMLASPRSCWAAAAEPPTSTRRLFVARFSYPCSHVFSRLMLYVGETPSNVAWSLSASLSKPLLPAALRPGAHKAAEKG